MVQEQLAAPRGTECAEVGIRRVQPDRASGSLSSDARPVTFQSIGRSSALTRGRRWRIRSASAPMSDARASCSEQPAVRRTVRQVAWPQSPEVARSFGPERGSRRIAADSPPVFEPAQLRTPGANDAASGSRGRQDSPTSARGSVRRTQGEWMPTDLEVARGGGRAGSSSCSPSRACATAQTDRSVGAAVGTYRIVTRGGA